MISISIKTNQLVAAFFFAFYLKVDGFVQKVQSAQSTIMFKITHPNSPTTSYLFGTHHAFGKAFFDTLQNAEAALNSCEVLVLKSVEQEGHTVEEIIHSRSSFTTWEKYLNKKDLAYLKDLFAQSPTDFKKLSPTEMHVFLMRYYRQQVCLRKAESDSSLSLDNYTGQLAKQNSLEIIGLETPEEQIVLINKDVEGMPRKIHKKRLAGIIKTIRTGDQSGCSETEWYAEMRIDYRLNETCGNSLMLTDRNTKWMQTLTELLYTKSCFIVVGLSHLMFKCGLINQLKELGYIIEPFSVR